MTHREQWQPKFEKFHKENPHVYEKLVEMANKVRERGLRCSIYFLVERVRWFYMIETEGGEGFKMNNNLSPFYARLIMEQEPGFAGFFDIRDHEPPTRKPYTPVGMVSTEMLPDFETL